MRGATAASTIRCRVSASLLGALFQFWYFLVITHQCISEFDMSGAICHYRCTMLFNERSKLMFTLDIAALEAQEMGGGLSVTFPFS